jgi:predicted esterase YcpF (UPF0227 family)
LTGLRASDSLPPFPTLSLYLLPLYYLLNIFASNTFHLNLSPLVIKRTIIYFHGFNSDGIGYKPDALRAHFENDNIIALDLEADPAWVKETIGRLIEDNEEELYFLGTSLGGFYAWYFGAITKRPAFLYNPSMKPHITLDDRGVGEFKTWTKGRDYNFKGSFLPVLEEMADEAKNKEVQSNMNFFLATDDDVLDHSALAGDYPAANYLKWFDNVGHRFSTFADTMRVLDQLIKGYEGVELV